jgi:hypothetical protein
MGQTVTLLCRPARLDARLARPGSRGHEYRDERGVSPSSKSCWVLERGERAELLVGGNRQLRALRDLRGADRYVATRAHLRGRTFSRVLVTRVASNAAIGQDAIVPGKPIELAQLSQKTKGLRS